MRRLFSGGRPPEDTQKGRRSLERRTSVASSSSLLLLCLSTLLLVALLPSAALGEETAVMPGNQDQSLSGHNLVGRSVESFLGSGEGRDMRRRGINHYFRSMKKRSDPSLGPVRAAPKEDKEEEQAFLRSLRSGISGATRSLRGVGDVNHYFRSLRAGNSNHYFRSLRSDPGWGDNRNHYFRSLRSSSERVSRAANRNHYFRSLRSASPPRSNNHYFRSLRSLSGEEEEEEDANKYNNHYFRSLRSARDYDHFFRSLRSGADRNHYFRSLKSGGLKNHYFRSLRSSDNNHYFRSLRSEGEGAATTTAAPSTSSEAPPPSVPHASGGKLKRYGVNHYFRTLRSDPLMMTRTARSAATLDQQEESDEGRNYRTGWNSQHYFRSLRSQLPLMSSEEEELQDEKDKRYGASYISRLMSYGLPAATQVQYRDIGPAEVLHCLEKLHRNRVRVNEAAAVAAHHVDDGGPISRR